MVIRWGSTVVYIKCSKNQHTRMVLFSCNMYFHKFTNFIIMAFMQKGQISAGKPSSPHHQNLSWFPQYEATRSKAKCTPLGQDAIPSQVTPQHFVRFPWVEKGTVRVKCLTQEHNTTTQPGLEPGPLDAESSMPTIKEPSS